MYMRMWHIKKDNGLYFLKKKKKFIFNKSKWRVMQLHANAEVIAAKRGRPVKTLKDMCHVL